MGRESVRQDCNAASKSNWEILESDLGFRV